MGQKTSIFAPEVHEMEDQSLIMAHASEKIPHPLPCIGLSGFSWFYPISLPQLHRFALDAASSQRLELSELGASSSGM